MRAPVPERSGAGWSDERAWAAVLARDHRLDGAFVYAVRTTGVFCRPSCGARRPRRAHVEFFRAPAEARRAGYRACARCRPESAEPRGAAAAVERAVAFLDRHLDERVTLAALARAVGVSPFHLQRIFTRAIGASPRAYQESRRLAGFKARVRGGEELGMATYGAGFGSSRGLYESARGGLGMTPGAYRRGGRGERVRFTVAASDLGSVLVAATARGVCAVQLGPDEAALERGLRAEFPAATLERDDAGLQEAVREVVRAAAGEGASAALPLDLRGTAFQLRVWRALRAIPAGETRTYGELARALGVPGGSRAVGAACAANAVALLVPCHRVVRDGGALGGYRWGVPRKRRLLARERAAIGRVGAAGPSEGDG